MCSKTTIPFIVLFAALSAVTFSWSAAHAQVTLTVGKGSALPPATDSPVSISLDNPGNDVASGMTINVCDVNDLLECTGCELTDRTADFSCSVAEQPNGCCRVVLFNLSSVDIETGTGPIVTILNTVSSEATGESCKELRILDDVQIADAASQRQLTVELQSGGFCFPCGSDADCDDGLYCTGIESCTDDSCVLDTNPCPEGTACVEATGDYDCVAPPTTTTIGPSSTTTTGPSTTTTITDSTTTTTGPSSTTTTVSGDASIEVVSGNVWKSRWVALPKLLVIEGTDTGFQPFKTTVAYDPRDAVLKLFPLVLGDKYIWNLILVMPGWFAGTGDQEVTVTVTTGDEVVSDDFLIQELPFIFDQNR